MLTKGICERDVHISLLLTLTRITMSTNRNLLFTIYSKIQFVLKTTELVWGWNLNDSTTSLLPNISFLS